MSLILVTSPTNMNKLILITLFVASTSWADLRIYQRENRPEPLSDIEPQRSRRSPYVTGISDIVEPLILIEERPVRDIQRNLRYTSDITRPYNQESERLIRAVRSYGTANSDLNQLRITAAAKNELAYLTAIKRAVRNIDNQATYTAVDRNTDVDQTREYQRTPLQRLVRNVDLTEPLRSVDLRPVNNEYITELISENDRRIARAVDISLQKEARPYALTVDPTDQLIKELKALNRVVRELRPTKEHNYYAIKPMSINNRVIRSIPVDKTKTETAEQETRNTREAANKNVEQIDAASRLELNEGITNVIQPTELELTRRQRNQPLIDNINLRQINAEERNRADCV